MKLIRKIPVLPILAVGMLLFAGAHVLKSQTPRLRATPPITPTRSPYPDSVAGSGMVESQTENVAVGSQVPGVVVEVRVQVGQKVRPGDVLFVLDARHIEADRKVRETQLVAARAQLERLRSMPRSEELPPILAQIEEARANLLQREDSYERSQRLQKTNAITDEELIRNKQAVLAAKAQLQRTEAEEQLLRAGAWAADIAVSEADVARAEAELQKIRTELERYQTTAPVLNLPQSQSSEAVEWEVLQVDVRPGEYVGTPPGQPLILLGDTGPRHLRVDIDEYDIPRFQRGAPARAFVRGDGDLAYDLQFVRVEPFVVPKKSLTGESAERVDTRVLQVIYQFAQGGRDVYVGQQMDVYVAAKQIEPKKTDLSNGE